MSDLQRNILKAKFNPDQIIEDPGTFSVPEIRAHKLRYTSAQWSEYWQVATTVESFRIYLIPPTPEPGKAPAWFIFHHGAGSSALTFSVLSRYLRDALPSVGLLAFDARGHGESVSEGTLTLDTLVRDFVRIVVHAVTESGTGEAEVVFVGHSLGGAVVTAAVDRLKELWPADGVPRPVVSGLVVLDVVEGSALEGLGSMRSYLAGRPQYFRSVEDGIRWHVKSHTVRNVESACVSVPPIIHPSGDRYTWTTDLAATEPYWREWFADLSSKFLSARTGKLLVLAGTDRLDRKLTIGQMQGKYQLEVLPEVGHFIQEDAPDRLATLLQQFWHRNRRGAALELNALNSGYFPTPAVMPKK